MNYLLFVFVFAIILFLYLHIYFHLKTSNDLEVYEIDQPSKQKLEEICDLRQPVLLKFYNDKFLEDLNLANVVENYGAFDIQIRNTKQNDNKAELYLPFILNESIELFKQDNQSKYFTEANELFLEETGLIKIYRYNDAFLRPPMVSKCMYDYIVGSQDTTTPLRYTVNYRNYFLVTHGKITIKLLVPHSSKYLYGENDYLNFEYSSPVNPWNVQTMYKQDFDKIKTMDITLEAGDLVFIPAYWWYSIRFDEISSICSFQYRTYMNTLAICPQLFIHGLQKMNVKREIVKKHPVEERPQEQSHPSQPQQQLQPQPQQPSIQLPQQPPPQEQLELQPANI